MKKVTFLAAMALLLVPTVSVFAQTELVKELDSVARCEAFIELSQERYNANELRQAEHAERLTTSIEKLNAFVEKASALGIDASSLESDISSMESYKSKLNASYEAVQTHLTSTIQLDCDITTSEDIQTEISEARSLYDVVKADVLSIRGLRESIKAQVVEILEQKIPSSDDSAS